jgi:chemotaxis protein methyltransferase CheR
VILCRNVFIYFDPSTIEKILKKIEPFLLDQGLLVLSPAENLQMLQSDFQVYEFEGTFFYLKKERKNPTHSSVMEKKPLEKYFKRELEKKEDIIHKMSDIQKMNDVYKINPSEKIEKTYTSDMASLLEKGEYEQVKKICQDNLKENPLQTALYRTLLEVELNLGEKDSAIHVLRKILYLEPDDIWSRYLLARTLKDTGNHESGKLEYKNILKNIHKHDFKKTLPHSDGMSYSLLKDLCEKALE